MAKVAVQRVHSILENGKRTTVCSRVWRIAGAWIGVSLLDAGSTLRISTARCVCAIVVENSKWFCSLWYMYSSPLTGNVLHIGISGCISADASCARWLSRLRAHSTHLWAISRTLTIAWRVVGRLCCVKSVRDIAHVAAHSWKLSMKICKRAYWSTSTMLSHKKTACSRYRRQLNC